MSKCDLCLFGCVGGKHLVEYGQNEHVCVCPVPGMKRVQCPNRPARK